MGIWNDRKLIVNCLPLTESERAQFIRAAKDIPQEFVGDSTQRGSMSWTAAVPEELKAKATAVIGNIAPEECVQCPKLEWLQTWSAGVDKYQQQGVLQPGSMLTNATGAYGQSVSEHMFASMWAIMKNLHIYAAGNANAIWHDAGRAVTPDGKTALMIGTGDIGSHFARLCKAVGMETIGVRRNPSIEAEGIDHIVGFESLDDVLQYADVIAMCVPSTSTTYHLLNAERIASLKPDAIIINAGRGDAIESQALADALAEGRIRGAALDVTEPEPLPANSPLWCEPKCLITPHVAGGNHLEITERSIISIALGNVRCYANGQSLDNRMPLKG
ncbi:D-2-hydroxyacid dehydrogenase [Bifidobacterium pseudocatenulatum]|uniref:D-2-hydroxyacid dehydrogenase n=1 Tax=Bifidobacterium pseudocatenulatum TaxID=28026 RepID=UPI0022E00885|nr:D-2-hydroxyacid dehydrogenase [Bifidobacterium pseudocatenulatum]